MNEYIKNSIMVRKSSIFDYYDINDNEVLDKINLFFKRVEDYASSIDDPTTFENYFLTNFNDEYMDLFSLLATKCKVKGVLKSQTKAFLEKDNVIRNVKEEIKYHIDDAVQDVRHAAYVESMDKLRDTPIVGDLLQAKQNLDMLNKLRKHKDD